MTLTDETVLALHPAVPGLVRDPGADATTSARAFAVQADGLAGRARQASATSEGVLTAPLLHVADPASDRARRLSGAALLVTGVLEQWADAVETFDRAVLGLRSELRTDPSRLPELRHRHAVLADEVERAGDDCARLLAAGPTPEALRTLAAHGHVTPADLSVAAGPGNVDAVLARLVDQDVLPAEALVWTPDELDTYLLAHPDVAAALLARRPVPAGPDSLDGALAALTTDVVTAPGGGAAVLEQRRVDARALFDGLGERERRLLAMLYPGVVGSLSGVPFEQRAQANRVGVVAALADERDRLAGLRDQHEQHQGDGDFLGLNDDDLEDAVAGSASRVALYESILADDRSILLLDPTGDGSVVELHGDLDAGTRNVGVLVPGTTSDMASFESGVASHSRSFVAASPDESLAMISWLGGDLPDRVLQDAPSASYSIDLGPRLAEFSRDVEQEVAHQAPGASTTYLGHSYGGAVVGRAELAGLEADRVLHVESAGMGHDVWNAGDLPTSQADVDRYSMTAPDDAIGLIQGVQGGDLGHGADPDEFTGTTRLDTGDTADGSGPINGLVDSHTGVFERGSDAWTNMYEVLTGGTASGYREPEYAYPPRGGFPVHTGWETDAPPVDVP